MNNELVQLTEFESFEILDVYEHGVAQPRRTVDALATISAGTKDAKGVPSWNRNGLIALHDPEGRAPGLRAALEANGYKSLTIAFPFNDPNQFIQQRFAEYSASKLLAYGDQHSITVLEDRARRFVYLAGTDEYNAAVARCKVQVNVYFNLAAWEPEPHITFPDGALTMYRLRFTSRNSLQNLKATLDHIRKFTRGLIAGIPLDTQFVVREVAGADGSRRKVPVWVFTLKPPQTRTLTSANLQSILLSGLEVGRSLMLPAPAEETVDTALEDVPDIDLDEVAEVEPSTSDVTRLETGFNPEEWRKKYFAIAEGTPYAEKHGRAWFIERYTHGATKSLSDVLRVCDAQAMQDMLDELSRIVERWRNGEQKIGELLKILFPSTATFIPDDVQAVMDKHAYTRKTFPDVYAMVDVYWELKALVDARGSTRASAAPLKFEELGEEQK